MPELTRLGSDLGEAARPIIAAAGDDAHPPRLYVNRETVSVPLHLKAHPTIGRRVDKDCHTWLDARRHWIRRLIGRLFRGRSRHAALTHKFAKMHERQGHCARPTVSREKPPAFRQTPLKRLIAKAATENMRPTTHSNSDA